MVKPIKGYPKIGLGDAGEESVWSGRRHGQSEELGHRFAGQHLECLIPQASTQTGASRFEKTRAIVLDCRWMRDRSRSIGIANRPAGETVAHGDGEGTARGRERTGDEHMPRFVKLATLDELPAGAAQEVEFEGRVYAIYNID